MGVAFSLRKVFTVSLRTSSADLRASSLASHLVTEASPNQSGTVRLVDRVSCEEIDRPHPAEPVLNHLTSGFAPQDPTHFLSQDPPEVRGAGHLRAPCQGTLRFYAPTTSKRLYDYAFNYAYQSISPPPSSGAQVVERALSLLGGGSERSENDGLFRLANELCEKKKAHLDRLISSVPSVRNFDVVLTDPATDFCFVSNWLAGLSERQQRPFTLQFHVEKHHTAFRSEADDFYAQDHSFANLVTKSLLSLPQTPLLTRLDLGALTLFDKQRKDVLFSFASMTGLKELRFRTDEKRDPNISSRPETESLEGLRLPRTLERLAIHFSPRHYQQQDNRLELRHFAGAIEHLAHLRYFCFSNSSEFGYARVWEPLLPSLTGLPALCELDLGEDPHQELGAGSGMQLLAALVMQSSSLRRLALPLYLLQPVELAAANALVMLSSGLRRSALIPHLLQPVELAAAKRDSALTLVSRSVVDGGEGSEAFLHKTFIPASASHPASILADRGTQISMRWLEF